MATKTELENQVIEQLIDSQKLVLYNDDFNTFDHVIACLIKVCEHSEIQAEQCAHIVHFKGKCNVKNGSFDDLKPLHKSLSNQNLTVEIE